MHETPQSRRTIRFTLEQLRLIGVLRQRYAPSGASLTDSDVIRLAVEKLAQEETPTG